MSNDFKSFQAEAYLQGVKFYSPEVSGASPEAVEYWGVRNLVEAVSSTLRTEADSVRVFDPAQQVPMAGPHFNNVESK